jgi:hypothetical protein
MSVKILAARPLAGPPVLMLFMRLLWKDLTAAHYTPPLFRRTLDARNLDARNVSKQW